MSNLAYIDTPCDRCGSKRRVSRTWSETVPTFTGTTVVQFSQVVCVNEACQKAFDEVIEKESKQRALLRVEKEKKDQIRKANSQAQMSSSPKSKSRI